ncbi:MAG: class I SAM-dependent methyltransferase [Actinomycetota bacterium]
MSENRVGALIETMKACPVCGHASSRALYSISGYTFMRCASCSLRFASPRPTASDISAIYESEYFDSKGWVGDPTSDSSYMQRCWEQVAPELGAPRSLLDVGCATGAFISAARADGWSVAGLEYSEAAAARGRALGLDIRSGSLSDGAFANETFDVITAWHVIEHLIDPIADLRAMRALCRDGGTLLIETPNARSIGALLKRERWAQARPPEHINFFDRDCLQRALASTGWRMRSSKTLYKRDTAERIAKLSVLKPAARIAARASELVGMGGNLRAFAEAV